MGTHTSTRSFPGLYGKTTFNGNVLTGTQLPYLPVGAISGAQYTSGDPYQITTSYRSGRKWDATPVDLELGSSRTWGSATRDIVRSAEDEYSSSRPYDTGHVFSSTKLSCEGTYFANLTGYYGGTYKYSGHFVPVFSYGVPGYGSVAGFDPAWYGTRAINATKPTSPNAGLATLLAELKREGFPMPGSALREFLTKKNPSIPDGLSVIGGEHLNYEFGVKPVLSEVRKLADSAKTWRQKLEQLERDSGRVTRRRMSFPDTVTSEVLSNYVGGQVLPISPSTGTTNAMFPAGKYSSFAAVRRVTRRQVWFSGAYKYLLPSLPETSKDNGDGGLIDRIKILESRCNQLLGTRVNADVAWELLPWSWLVDWHVNLGTMISNAEALSSDGLVLKYGYIMCRTTIETTATSYGPVLPNGYKGPYTTTWKTDSKTRYRANPYGFSLNPSSYTARQWAILGSLGLTKAPGILH